jgi:hypothetical protein
MADTEAYKRAKDTLEKRMTALGAAVTKTAEAQIEAVMNRRHPRSFEFARDHRRAEAEAKIALTAAIDACATLLQIPEPPKG